MEKETILKLKEDLIKDLENVTNSHDLEEISIKYLSKKSTLSQAMQSFRTLSREEKVEYGKLINEVRTFIESKISEASKTIKEKELIDKLESDKIDITAPSSLISTGAKNPFYLVSDEIVDIFVSMGFKVVEGPEVESDHYNFELLNIPKNHPARDMQDTFYINSNLLLRTHTSPAQAHELEKNPNKPLMIICPGKTYRRDDDDMTHSHQFAQVEGLVVGKGITLANLKATLELFVKKMFGEKREIRLRSSYFPFTEPSVEVDVSCAECNGKGCQVCKGTGYIEILGAGMVHPNVLKMANYDPEIYSGFAFGVGIERVAMLRYDINDIRKIYTNDIRFLNQFKKRG